MARGGFRRPANGMQGNSKGSFPLWTKEEDAIIRELVHGPLIKARLPHRTMKSIQFRRIRLGVRVKDISPNSAR
jgi:hypothetical protein